MENRKDSESEIMCPFHLDDNIEHIYDVFIQKTGMMRPLWKCTRRQEFFWGDDGERLEGLYFMCETRWEDQGLCNEKILDIRKLNGQTLMGPEAQRRIDRICGNCEHKKFSIGLND